MATETEKQEQNIKDEIVQVLEQDRDERRKERDEQLTEVRGLVSEVRNQQDELRELRLDMGNGPSIEETVMHEHAARVGAKRGTREAVREEGRTVAYGIRDFTTGFVRAFIPRSMEDVQKQTAGAVIGISGAGMLGRYNDRVGDAIIRLVRPELMPVA